MGFFSYFGVKSFGNGFRCNGEIPGSIHDKIKVSFLVGFNCPKSATSEANGENKMEKWQSLHLIFTPTNETGA